jgi:hypothetical protein
MENMNRVTANDLKGWDGYGKRGEAIYDAMFEQEKNEMIELGLECKCGLPKWQKEDKYCEGDYCTYDYA